jgi:hypothetical protein
MQLVPRWSLSGCASQTYGKSFRPCHVVPLDSERWEVPPPPRPPARARPQSNLRTRPTRLNRRTSPLHPGCRAPEPSSTRSRYPLRQQPVGPLVLGVICAQIHIPRLVARRPPAIGTSHPPFHRLSHLTSLVHGQADSSDFRHINPHALTLRYAFVCSSMVRMVEQSVSCSSSAWL